MSIQNLPFEWLALADAVAKATVILAAAAAASFVFRRASAAFRHLVWTLALCGVLALPLFSAALPKWHVPLVTVTPAQPVMDEVAPPPVHATQPRRTRAEPSVPVAAAPPADTQPLPAPRSLASLASALTWQQALLAIWFCGVVTVVARLAVGLAAVYWLSRRTQVITDAAWLPLARALAAEMGVGSRLRFMRSTRASMPVAAGIFRPSIIMPADADEWTESRLRIVLLHELAHVKRRDCLTHLIAQTACALYWFNPLTWLAAKRARTERERACDDLVLAFGTHGPDYADQLLEMARAMRGGRLSGLLRGASLAMAHQSQLEGRLIAILDPKVPRAGVSRVRALAAIVIVCAAVAPLGALQPWKDGASEVASAPSAAVPETISETVPETINLASTIAPGPERPARSGASVEQASLQPQLPDRQPPQVAETPDAAALIEEVIAPITAATVEAVGKNIEGLEKAITAAVEDASQDPKPEPKPKGKEGSGRTADPRLVAALTAALKDTDKEVRENAMHALVRLRDPAIFEPLVQALKDGSPDVREQAVHGLSQLRDRRAIEPLTAALKDENADVREQAAFGLGQLRDRSTVPALTAALKDADADVREKAAFSLGQLRDPSAVDGLAIAVRDENPGVREQAVFALSQIRDRRAVSPLISALKDAHADVRKQAAFALGQLRDAGAVEALIVAVKDANVEVREQVVFALGQIRDPRAIDALTVALKDQSAKVRQQAAFALGQLIR